MDFSLFEVSEPFTVGSEATSLLGITITVDGRKSLVAISHECIHEISGYTGEPSYEVAKHLFEQHRTNLLCGIYDQLLKLENEHNYLVKRCNGEYVLDPY